MKINLKVIKNLKFGAVKDKVNKASEKGLKDVIVDIANTVINVHPWKTRTGNNSRSIKYEVEGSNGKVYSTSGYGGILETGSVKMKAYPYFKPALDRHIGKLPGAIKGHLR